MAKAGGFIETFGLWTDEQRRAASRIREKVRKEKLKLIRLAWSDPQGASRAKTFTVAGFLNVLESGATSTVATATIDASSARVFSSFTRGGGMGLDEMTGSPNQVIVPDPLTFRVLPWQPDMGWVLGDEYFSSGQPFHFSTRHLLRKCLAQLEKRGMRSVVGLEVEWYLFRLAQDHLTDENVGHLGLKGRPVSVVPAEPGYLLHSESNMDRIHAPVSTVATMLEQMGLPLRSIEKELGPGQLECTFAPTDALQAADNLFLFRTATRQICWRMGFLASFMCRPGFNGYPSSGWHLHQSLVEAKSGRNLFTPRTPGEALSPLGMNYLGGLLRYAIPSTVFATPTVNGYRRFRANSLAPDRVAWGMDHRGAMLRVLAGPRDPASRVENRIGEPAANPYLYIASQVITGAEGIAARLDPGSPETDPYATNHPALPKSLPEALEAMEREPLFCREFGELFVNYYLKFKRTELDRYETFSKEHAVDKTSDATTEWEQSEYFDFF